MAMAERNAQYDAWLRAKRNPQQKTMLPGDAAYGVAPTPVQAAGTGGSFIRVAPGYPRTPQTPSLMSRIGGVIENAMPEEPPVATALAQAAEENPGVQEQVQKEAERGGGIITDLTNNIQEVRTPDPPGAAAVDDKDSPNKFMQWWNSDAGRIRRGSFFDAITHIGAGLAGIPLGGSDMSSVSRGIAATASSYERAATRYHTGQFRNQLQSRIDTELKSDTPDQTKLTQWRAAMANPGAFIKGSMANGGIGAFDKMQLAVEQARRIKLQPTRAETLINNAADQWLVNLTEEDREKLSNMDNLIELTMTGSMGLGDTPMEKIVMSLLSRNMIGKFSAAEMSRHADAMADIAAQRRAEGADETDSLDEAAVQSQGQAFATKAEESGDAENAEANQMFNALTATTTVDQPKSGGLFELMKKQFF